MSKDLVNIEVNGMPLKARPGQMLIEVTDNAGVYIPRFCYHEKLSVAANCRMCLVEVDQVPKPMPACATPVAEGMKVFTKSPRAISAQKATMEFLLINHPLDCPICDQGGECELQDLAMGFGSDVSRFTERKRVVKDKNLGPLVSTDMTRCIHCTRCVRFGQEIAGIQELGTTGRGENMEIGTYIERSVDHELSGNIIDLCPVGALNNKPFRFRARAWEMDQRATIAPHDCVGSNVYAHILRGRLMRIVPRPNEAVNETWISDRDRYSHEAVYSDDRVKRPMIRVDDEWQETDWDTALTAAAKGIQDSIEKHGAEQFGVLVSPSATLEEQYLLAKLARATGSNNIDARLQQSDNRDQEHDPMFPGINVSLADIENQNAIVVFGSNLRKEAPMLAHRVRKAAMSGAAVSFINPAKFDYLFPVADYLDSPAGAMVSDAAALLSAAAENAGKDVPAAFRTVCGHVDVGDRHRSLAKAIAEKDNKLVLLGQLAIRHSAYSDIRALVAAFADICGARIGYVTEGGNLAGAYLAGAVPHRKPGGRKIDKAGLGCQQMLEDALKAYMLFGIEPEFDTARRRLAIDDLHRAECVVVMSSYVTETMQAYASVILPIGTFAETSGTFVNAEGRWQSFSGVANPVGEARPGWKVLRVLANLMDADGFDYMSTDDVRTELAAVCGDVKADNAFAGTREIKLNGTGSQLIDIPMYQVDALVRRALALQLTVDGQKEAAVY